MSERDYLALFNVLKVFKVISKWVPTCDSHSHGDFIMLSTGKPGHQHHTLISHSVTLT